MNINFENAETFSITKKFNGKMEDGRSFIIVSEWNDWDGWSIDKIELEDGTSLSEDEERIVCNYFLENMN